MDATRATFMFLLLLSQILGIVMVAFVAVWTAKGMGGFGWDGSIKEFNFHPLFMVCGFTLLYGEAAVSFRVFTHTEKSCVKVLHAVLLIVAFASMVVGLKAAYDFHNVNHFPNLYSLHSWCGMATVLLFSLQYFFGFISFLFPKLPQAMRAAYMPIHRYFGLAIFFLLALSSISGINEQLLFLFPGSKYSELPFSAVMGNCLGAAIVAFTVVVGFIVHNPDWQRNVGESEPLSIHFKPLSTESKE